MKTMTTRTICQLTPMAALPVKPTMLPCSPAMTFCSIVGHAIIQTAAPMGPSTMARLNLRWGLGGSATKVLGLWNRISSFAASLVHDRLLHQRSDDLAIVGTNGAW